MTTLNTTTFVQIGNVITELSQKRQNLCQVADQLPNGDPTKAEFEHFEQHVESFLNDFEVELSPGLVNQLEVIGLLSAKLEAGLNNRLTRH